MKLILKLSLMLFSQLGFAEVHGGPSFLPPDVIIRQAEHAAPLARKVRISNPSLAHPSDSNLSPDLATCRARIEQVVCWVNPPTSQDNENDAAHRPCLPGSEKFAAFFQGHFDRSPDFIQRMYCHVDRLWIEKNFVATAYATPVSNSQGQMIAGGVGVRQEVLESTLGLDDWISWKEETTFGGGVSLNSPSLGLIRYHSNKNSKEFFLDYVMDHEFGHLFDFANQLNRTTTCEYKETSPGVWERIGDCLPLPGS